MLKKIFKIQDTIDVYISESNNNQKILLTFSKVTTRERIEILVNRDVAKLLALLDGKKTFQRILNELGNYDEIEAKNLINYLLSQHIIVEIDTLGDSNHLSRYKRQIAFFNDFILARSGEDTQSILQRKKVVVLGCGAIGSAISEILVRAGIQSIILVDYKVVIESSLDRHIYLRKNDLGKSKVQTLMTYLSRINSNLNVIGYEEKLIPSTDLSQWIDSDASLIINSCDEPYIGHTSLKVGRFAAERNIPFYVAGGFDAHLMSSGELIYPPLTPCIDCAQKTFTKSLEGWKPTYSNTADNNTLVTEYSEVNSIVSFNNYQIGGAGGLAMMSGFSANLSALKILQFLTEDYNYNYKPFRYEYLPNTGELTQFEMLKQEHCNVCKS